MEDQPDNDMGLESLDPDSSGTSSIKTIVVAVKPKAFKFYPKLEIDLLKEICLAQPFKAKHGEVTGTWTSIAEKCGSKYSGETARRHYNAIMQQFIKEDHASLKKSGTEEEYDEKMQLLQDLRDLTNDAQVTKNLSKSRTGSEQESREKGEELRKAAMESLVASKSPGGGGDYEPRTKKAKQDRLLSLMEKQQASKDKQLELDDRRLALNESKWKVEAEEKKALLDILKQQLNRNNN